MKPDSLIYYYNQIQRDVTPSKPSVKLQFRYPGLGALVCAGSLLVAACRVLDPWARSGLCLGMICPGVSGLWVHGWICSGVDGCRRGPWARRCISLGLLHCGWFPWDSPQLLSGGVAVVPAGVPVL
ncbi:hypothetical protein ATANTOWER_002841 [Ataeniobius toweri]|uniref:Uncharacterized protein n=1 Tax=Ataeniobius toweri TaxID=208326 RepID=A0ABU7AM97_9TELE|nr:hypothetical protein [Ataeniobius toweri]